MSTAENHALNTPDLTETSPEHWRYLSEGGATIVFSYTGPPNPIYSGKVLRVRKASNPSARPVERSEGASEDFVFMFYRDVIRRMLDPSFLPDLVNAYASQPWLSCLSDRAERARPQERRDANRIDTSCTNVTLATDLVGGHGLAIEIKPKWGFLPNPHHLSTASHPLKTRTCRMCMRNSMFCPLDLFSGERPRVRRALEGLWTVWNSKDGKTNSLRIFVDGQIITPQYPESLSNSLGLGLPSHSISELRDAFIDIVLPVLTSTPVLRQLATLQRTLDALDIEGLARLYEDVRNVPIGHTSMPEVEPNIDEWRSFVDEYLARQHGRAPDTMESEEARLRYHMLAYVLSATFKDCSLMLRIPRAGEADKGSIKVIDLDVKSIGRLPLWQAFDKEVVAQYMSIPETERKYCINCTT